jgi:hypothetical protein
VRQRSGGGSVARGGVHLVFLWATTREW